MSTFWNLWIVGFVTANIIFIAWLLYATSSGKKSDQPAGPETTGHIWDGDLQEYNNPLPPLVAGGVLRLHCIRHPLSGALPRIR